MKNFSRYHSGFTLIEAIVSITLLVIAIVGPMALARQSLRVSRDARAELEAVHLAEEGIEIVRSIRDNNSADDNTASPAIWMTGILSECSAGCIPDVSDHSGGGPNPVWGPNALRDCSGGAGCTNDETSLYKHTTSGLYRQKVGGLTPAATWKRSDFTRLITATNVVAGRQVRVISTVTYKSFNNQVRTITTNEDLYNWFPYLQ